ncbi:MAG: DUF2783 domain-containing protein [Jannaschia sp.]
MSLILDPNISDPDGFYNELLAAHRDLDAAESGALNARLILILANHLGDRDVLRDALRMARDARAVARDAPMPSSRRGKP